jgi:AraC-like DNA-binding protein
MAGPALPGPAPAPARRETRHVLCRLVDAIAEPAWIADVDGSVLYLNRAWNGLGLSLADLTGAELTDHEWHGPAGSADRAGKMRWAEPLAAGLPFQRMRRVMTRSAGERFVTTIAIPLRDEAGRIRVWCGIERVAGACAPNEAAVSEPALTVAEAAAGEASHLAIDIVLDSGIVPLMKTLADARDMQAGVGMLYLQSISVAILARLGNGRLIAGQTPARRQNAPLAKWRLARVVDHVERNLGEPIWLADLAKAAGLTKMYFAAQFRAAMGVGPHEYVLACRIRHAQGLLRQVRTPLAEVALESGFQTQSHFTTVFRRHVGETPHRWRTQQFGAAAERVPPPPRPGGLAHRIGAQCSIGA